MNLKSQVGIAAASYVKNHMTVGLGTGSTAAYLVGGTRSAGTRRELNHDWRYNFRRN